MSILDESHHLMVNKVDLSLSQSGYKRGEITATSNMQDKNQSLFVCNNSIKLVCAHSSTAEEEGVL